MERRGAGRSSTGMEAWHGEERGEKAVNRDGGVAWRGGRWEGRQQGWRRGMERRGRSSTGMEVWGGEEGGEKVINTIQSLL